VAGSKGTFCIENCIEKLTYWPAPKPGEKFGLGEGPQPEVMDTGIKDFGATFPRRIHAFLEDVTNGVPLEHLRASGRDALATLEYIFAVIESYENGGALVRPHALPRFTAIPAGSDLGGSNNMIKLGVNTVLFQGHDLATAMQHIAWAGYDGSSCRPSRACASTSTWTTGGRRRTRSGMAGRGARPRPAQHGGGVAGRGPPDARRSRRRRRSAFRSSTSAPGGKSNVEEDLQRQIALIRAGGKGGAQGVTLCVQGARGPASTTRRRRCGDGEDRVPRLRHRHGPQPHLPRRAKRPAQALPQVLSRVRHIHIRDCKGRGPEPGRARTRPAAAATSTSSATARPWWTAATTARSAWR
jgi:hypothetical protein